MRTVSTTAYPSCGSSGRRLTDGPESCTVQDPCSFEQANNFSYFEATPTGFEPVSPT
jgi:hypothetical protein